MKSKSKDLTVNNKEDLSGNNGDRAIGYCIYRACGLV